LRRETSVLPTRICLFVAILVLVGPSAFSQGVSRLNTPNGIYAVIREDSTRAGALSGNPSHIVLIYDGRYVDSTQTESPRYITVDSSFFVPLILEGPPDAKMDGHGHTLLSVSLSQKYAGLLEQFTKAHLGGRVAIVLDGEVITMHRVRSVVQRGKFQITRCYDNACEVLRAKLMK
jgi:hypothetical protein